MGVDEYMLELEAGLNSMLLVLAKASNWSRLVLVIESLTLESVDDARTIADDVSDKLELKSELGIMMLLVATQVSALDIVDDVQLFACGNKD